MLIPLDGCAVSARMGCSQSSLILLFNSRIGYGFNVDYSRNKDYNIGRGDEWQ